MAAVLTSNPPVRPNGRLSRNPRRGQNRPRPRLVWVNPELSPQRRKEKSESSPVGSYGRVLYNYFRDYEPQTGRYVQSDPIGIYGGINTWIYAKDSPLLHTDRFGLSPDFPDMSFSSPFP
ncbi:MAG: hypothetical protein HND55_04095 [Pseudomonadota bacterium]|nr:MAG: hypothetical protein HND55_04095 [Pseudomonadota bacterium]